MSLIKKIFGNDKSKEAAPLSQPHSTQFHESESTNDEAESRNATRREMLQVILRDTMRKHGIPSDWMECRILSATTKLGRPGLHVTIIVKQAHDKLLGHLFAFQDSFNRELTRFEPRAFDWLLSVGWQFDGYVTAQKAMPDPKSWAGLAPAPSSAPAPLELPKPAEDVDAKAFAPTVDPIEEEEKAKAAKSAEAEGPDTVSDEVEADLQALFAIRDQALGRAESPPDFEPTRPGFDEPDIPRR
jgi:hypothetical protein